MSISLDEAVNLTRTGDVWVFRGRSVPDRAIQLTTNSPVNHVGMAVVLDDMPPLMWHAELGRSLPDMWTGTHQRGVQLHDLRDAVCVWANRYGQRAWLRQLDPPADAEMEKAVLRTVARLDGTPFPSTAQLAWRWLRGRVPAVRVPTLRGRDPERPDTPAPDHPGAPASDRAGARDRALETAYCAEVVAVTYEAMGLLPAGRRPNWYDPGRFWSGDDLGLAGGARLGSEIEVHTPPR
ncbi:hypothetical protein OG777_15510 [Micromonospora peucetia]|uniref:Guanylate cyclase n=1 Tax=Micromonospora peucetia TaxID=47871 RepID=A0A1C6VSU7_9ACTN|nr:hypothetical protein [Micromonospora peucetia]MCX4388330.1 hypothetical protein [Micromonospora peucetia]WSA31000.1 hypothetical protein OIE14_22960 [Micromonospora peucetia]SCL69184.1 hypothetical protein GA0070608_3934 [Micromonospora peucetia]